MSFPTTTEITTAKNSTYTSGTDTATGYYFANTEDPSPVAKIRGFLKAFIDLISYNENDVDKIVNCIDKAYVARTTTQTIPANTLTTIEYNTEISDPKNLHSSGVVTVTEPGDYLITGIFGHFSATSRVINANVAVSGANYQFFYSASVNGDVQVPFSLVLPLVANDTVSIRVSSNTSIDIRAGAIYNHLSVKLISL